MRALGAILLWFGAALAVIALAGRLSPLLDAAASFLPIAAAMILIGAALARSRRLLPVTLIGLAAALAGMLPEFTRPIPSREMAAPAIRIVTHNVLVRNAAPAATMDRLAALPADVLLLQEVNGTVAPVLSRAAARFPHRTPCPDDACALAILSRWPIVDWDYRFRDRTGRETGPPLIWARIAPPDGPSFVVATLHYPWPLPPGRQARMRTDLARTIRGVDQRLLIVAGDMNLTPWSQAMRRQDAMLAPLTRVTRAAFSWPATLPLFPIDHVYAGPGFATVRVDRLARTGSDHIPLRVTLRSR